MYSIDPDILRTFVNDSKSSSVNYSPELSYVSIDFRFGINAKFDTHWVNDWWIHKQLSTPNLSSFFAQTSPSAISFIPSVLNVQYLNSTQLNKWTSFMNLPITLPKG